MTSTDSTKRLPLVAVLASEVNHRSFMGLLAVLVVLLHGLAIIWLLQPGEHIHKTKPLKIMEVALLPKPEPKIKPEPKPKVEPKPKIIQPTPPKKIPPQKKAGKPPVKEKAPVVHKRVEPPKPQPVINKHTPPPKPQAVAHQQAELPRSQPVLTRKPTASTAPAPFASSAKKWSPPVHAPASKPTVSKPAEKTGNSGQGNSNVNSGIVSLGCPTPKYPMRATSRHIEGWVKIALTVTATGSVANVSVVDASPSGIFDSVAMDAASKCKFKPKMVNGHAVNQSATKTFTFNLR